MSIVFERITMIHAPKGYIVTPNKKMKQDYDIIYVEIANHIKGQ